MTNILIDLINPYLPALLTIVFGIVLSRWVIPWLKENKYLTVAKKFSIIANDMLDEYLESSGSTSITLEILDELIDKFIELTGADRDIAKRILFAKLKESDVKLKKANKKK